MHRFTTCKALLFFFSGLPHTHSTHPYTNIAHALILLCFLFVVYMIVKQQQQQQQDSTLDCSRFVTVCFMLPNPFTEVVDFMKRAVELYVLVLLSCARFSLLPLLSPVASC